MRRFGEKLGVLRKRHNMTFQRLATALEYASPSYVYEVEIGRKMPSVELVIKVARLFGISTDVLLFDELDLSNDTDVPP
jgi:transcriptional regulator with XRE-family HTH domain